MARILSRRAADIHDARQTATATMPASTALYERLDDVRPNRDAGVLRWLVVEKRVTMRRP